jgi:uncharacterized protein YheU (UPF0270 family)
MCSSRCSSGDGEGGARGGEEEGSLTSGEAATRRRAEAGGAAVVWLVRGRAVRVWPVSVLVLVLVSALVL